MPTPTDFNNATTYKPANGTAEHVTKWPLFLAEVDSHFNAQDQSTSGNLIEAFGGSAAKAFKLRNVAGGIHLRLAADGLSGSIDQTDAAGVMTKSFLKFIANGAVESYHNDVLKFQTALEGVTVTGGAKVNAHDNADNMIIGTTSLPQTGITIVSTPTGGGNLYFSDGTSTGNAYSKGQISYNHSDEALYVYTNAIEAFNISSSQLVTFKDSIVITGSMKPATYNVAGAPSASAHGAGAVIYVSDGGAGNPVIAFSDGTNWKRSDTGATIS